MRVYILSLDVLRVLFIHRDKFLLWGNVSRSDLLMFVFINVAGLGLKEGKIAREGRGDRRAT